MILSRCVQQIDSVTRISEIRNIPTPRARDKMSSFPVDNSTKSFWFSEPDGFSHHRTTADLPQNSDIVIIGSGYSGTTTAHWLFEMGNPSVTMLEAREVCSGATGRNGGHLKPFFSRYHRLSHLDDRTIGHLINYEFEHLQLIHDLVRKLDIDCSFLLTRACDVYQDEELAECDRTNFFKALANPYVKPNIKASAQIIMGSEARIISKVGSALQIITYPAASIWPHKLIVALLKRCVSLGLNLQTNTLVTSACQLPNGKWKVSTPRGDIECSKIVFATNAYTKALLPEFDNKITPMKGVACHIESEKSPIPHLGNSFSFFKPEIPGDYLINRGDGSIVVGGGTEEVDSVDDATYCQQTAKYLTSHPNRNFSTWKTLPTISKYVWSGIMGYSFDEFPIVGEFQKNGYISAGFIGHGMPRVLLASKAIAECILEKKSIASVEWLPQPFKYSEKRMRGVSRVHKL